MLDILKYPVQQTFFKWNTIDIYFWAKLYCLFLIITVLKNQCSMVEKVPIKKSKDLDTSLSSTTRCSDKLFHLSGPLSSL